MAMTPEGLSAKILEEFEAAYGPITQGREQAATYYAIFGKAIIDYIKANAEIPAGIAVSTTGSETAQTGQTTAPGSII
jgi:hypothetical protein